MSRVTGVTGATGIEAKLGVFLVVDDPTTVFRSSNSSRRSVTWNPEGTSRPTATLLNNLDCTPFPAKS